MWARCRSSLPRYGRFRRSLNRGSTRLAGESGTPSSPTPVRKRIVPCPAAEVDWKVDATALPSSSDTSRYSSVSACPGASDWMVCRSGSDGFSRCAPVRCCSSRSTVIRFWVARDRLVTVTKSEYASPSRTTSGWLKVRLKRASTTSTAAWIRLSSGNGSRPGRARLAVMSICRVCVPAASPSTVHAAEPWAPGARLRLPVAPTTGTAWPGATDGWLAATRSALYGGRRRLAITSSRRAPDPFGAPFATTSRASKNWFRYETLPGSTMAPKSGRCKASSSSSWASSLCDSACSSLKGTICGGSQRATACATSGGSPSSETLGLSSGSTVPKPEYSIGSSISTISLPNAKPTAKLKAWKFSAVSVMPRALSSASERVRTVAEARRISRTWRNAIDGSARLRIWPLRASTSRMFSSR